MRCWRRCGQMAMADDRIRRSIAEGEQELASGKPMTSLDDLVYDGRARKRPSGASDLTQRIFMLLHDHPEGLTLDEIHGALREGWLETDYYRAYEQHVGIHRGPRSQQFGTLEFKRRAQRWAIGQVLKTMSKHRTDGVAARRVDDRWFKGERAPRITVHESRPRYVTHDWAAERRAAYRADTADRVRREEFKTRLFAALSDGRLKGKTRELIQDTYDYLCGR